MATGKHEIKCITKSDRYNPHERITHIGGYSGGSNWKLTQESAISSILKGEYAFYVSQGGRTVDVVVAESRYGNKYLKTVADGEQPDNLLSLYECK